MEPEEFVASLRDREPEEAGAWLDGKKPVVQRIPELPIETTNVIYDPRDDMVVEVAQVERDEPGYLEQFEQWVTAHLDSYEALQMVTQRPRELTRQALRDLEQELSRQGYSTKGLRNAYKTRTNQEIAASLIGFVRQAALGEPLVPYEERVDFAVQRIKNERDWSPQQRKWLDRIAKMLIKNETVADPANLEHGAFEAKGGFERINEQYFDGELGDVLVELNDQMWTYEAGA